MFGVNAGGNHDLNLFLLLAKWLIWKQSKSESDLNILMFLLHLSSYQRVQSCVYKMKGELDEFKGTNPALKKPSNIPEIYAKMFGRIH